MTTMKTETEIKKYAPSTIRKHRQQWLAALESGELKQCKGALAKTVQATGEPKSFCCLGVASILSGTPFENVKGTEANHWAHGTLHFATRNKWDEKTTYELLPTQAQAWLGVKNDDPHVHIPRGHPKDKSFDGAGVSLASMNDSGMRFTEIAALVREFGFIPEHDALVGE